MARKHPHKLIPITMKHHDALSKEAAREKLSLKIKLGEVIDEHLEKQGVLETDATRG